MSNCAEVRKWGSLMKYYTVYLKKSDEIVAFGTSEECASQLGFRNRSTFHNIASLSRKGKRKKYEIIVDDSPYEEEDE